MTTQRELWIGSVFTVEWDLVDTAGAPIIAAAVAGAVVRGTSFTAAMTITHATGSGTYRASWAATAAGTYGYRLTATVSSLPVGATGGSFAVTRSITGAEPIILDPADPVGMMRLLTTDVDEAFPILTDAQYLAFLGIEGGVIKKGAAAALEAIATSETLRTKKITTQDLSIDGPAVAEDLRKRAKLLRDQVRQDITNERDDTAYADGFGFDSVDFDPHASRWPGLGC